MLPIDLMTILGKYLCDITINNDAHNSYDYDDWPKTDTDANIRSNIDSNWIDDHKYTLSYTDGSMMEIHTTSTSTSTPSTNTHINSNSKMIFHFSDSMYDRELDSTLNGTLNNTYSITQQMPMIKLFMGVLISRKYVNYSIDKDSVSNSAIKFHFNLYNKETNVYDKPIDIIVDDRILLDNRDKPIIIDSTNVIDHLLLKAFIKLSNMMNIPIKNININSFVGLCKGHSLYKLKINHQVMDNLADMCFMVKNIHDDSPLSSPSSSSTNLTPQLSSLIPLTSFLPGSNVVSNAVSNRSKTKLKTKTKTESISTNIKQIDKHKQIEIEKQSTWISNNIMDLLTGEEPRPYNNYAAMVYDMFKQDILLGITIRDSFMYIITNVASDNHGVMKIRFYNIFTGNDIDLEFETVMYGINQIALSF